MAFTKTSQLFDLQKKTALVTGAARGIGQAIALRLADAGAAVVVCDINREGLEETVGQIQAAGGRAHAIAADLSDPMALARLADDAAGVFGGIDILVNNAALRGWSTWDTLTEGEWDRFMAVNQKAVFFLTQAVAKKMVEQKRGGSIVNIASTAAAHPVDWKVDYNTAKAGVAMMGKSLAKELGKHMIRVNTIGPGGTNTPGGSGSVDIPAKIPRDQLVKMGEAWRARMALPVGLMDPDDIARSVLFFASDLSRYVTGQVLFVDGGYLVG